MISELAVIDRKLQSWSGLSQSRGSEGCIPQRSSQGRICKDLPAPWSWHEQIVDLAHHLWLAFAMTLVCTSFWVLHGAHFCTFDWMLFYDWAIMGDDSILHGRERSGSRALRVPPARMSVQAIAFGPRPSCATRSLVEIAVSSIYWNTWRYQL